YRLEAANARAVESEAFGKAVHRELAQRQAEMLPGAWQVDEPDVDDLDALRLRALQHLARAGLADGLCFDCHLHPPENHGFDELEVIVEIAGACDHGSPPRIGWRHSCVDHTTRDIHRARALV